MASQLRKYLCKKNLGYSRAIIDLDIRKRKQLLRESTGSYIHEIRLLKKSLQAIRVFNQQSLSIVGSFRK